MDQQLSVADLANGATGELGDLDGPAGAPQQSGFREYAHLLWRKKWTIIIVVVIAVGLVLGYCAITTKEYTATASVLLEPTISSDFAGGGGNAANPSAIINVPNAIQVMQSTSIKDIVARTIPNPPDVSVTESGLAGTTDVVQISVSSSNPQTAAAAANAYALAYISSQKALTKTTFTDAQKQIQNKIGTVELAISDITAQIRATPTGVNQTINDVQLSNLEDTLTTLQNQEQQYQFYATQGLKTEVGTVISAATVPTSPSSPKTIEYTVLALIVGLVVGIGLVLAINAIGSRQ
jgi:uncharacterized protein involved in exopolysaccharide biosynthesis